MTEDIAAITCFFSYVGNSHAVQLYKEFKKCLTKQGVKLYTVELAFFDEDYLLDDEDVYLKLRTDTVLWHKESLLNVLVKRLPSSVKKVVWLDCDIFIENDNWANEVSELLNEYKVLELGKEHIYLGQDGQPERRHETTGYALSLGIPDWKNFAKYHPGLGWAGRRELFTDYGGLFEYGLSGGGDGIMAYIFADGLDRDGPGRDAGMKKWIPDWKYKVYEEDCPSMIHKIEEYKNVVAPYVKGSVSFLDARVFHKYHAPNSRRGYRSRPHILKGLDLHNDLSKDREGLFKWKDMRYNKVFEKFFRMKDNPKHLRRGSQITYRDLNINEELK